MSGPVYAITPALFPCPSAANFTATNTTVAKILVEQFPAAIATTTTPQFYGGCTAIDLLATSSDSVARDFLLYIGTVATTQGASTGAMTTTTSTIPRVSGSFIADGFLVGDQVMTFAPFGTAPNAGVDGIVAIVTAVAALTLTLSGTPIAALALATGTRVVRLSSRGRTTIPIAAGTNGTTKSQALIGTSTDGSLLTTEIKLGPNNLLIGGMQAAISALPAVVSIQPTIALY